jgi:hypothetical protein
MENKDLFTDETDKSLLTAFAWWEKKRVIYNMIMLITGLIIMLYFGDFDLLSLIGIILYGLIANIFYCLGFFIELAARHYFKSEKDFKQTRELIFWAGLIFSIVLTIWLGELSSMLVPD